MTCYGQTPEDAPSGEAGGEETAGEAPSVEPITLYVAPDGNDEWSGTLEAPNADGTDGPLASMEGARDAIRTLRENNSAQGPVTVLVREGIYRLTRTFTLEPQDSGRAGAEVTYAAYPGERPTISGGRAITGWTKEDNLWTTEVPEALSSDWRFSTLWVNGERRSRARTPNDGGFFETAGKAPPIENPDTGDMVLRSNNAFVYNPGDVVRWDNLDDVLVVVLHAWEMSFHHIASLDEENHIVTFVNAAVWAFENWGPKQRYFIENTFEGLDAPGEWYLNRQTGKLYYYPVEGEDLTAAEVIAPVLTQLVAFEGNPSTGQLVEYVRLRGLRFCHADFSVGTEGYAEFGSAAAVPGAIQGRGARCCAVEDCEIAHVDTYGIWLRVGCVANRIVRNELHDLGAGGVRIGERQRSSDALDVKHNVVDNNFIHDGGRLYSSGVGVWIGQSPLNRVSHNEICDLSNSGVAVGWVWGSQEGFSYGNSVEYNLIHHIGRGEFSNLAAVYVLGGSWNSCIRNNVIHDVVAYQYGGWGIHSDEGSSNLTIENNVVYNTTSGGFDHYYGNTNYVRNNIFAFSRDGQINLTNTRDAMPVIFERNIVVTNNGVPFANNWDIANIWQDYNCYWDTEDCEPDFGNGTFSEWQAKGKDVHSVFADPLFEDLSAYDFSLRPESPALALGFLPIDVASAGLYGQPEWVSRADAVARPPIELSALLQPAPARDDFESVAPGATPPGVTLFGADGVATVRVTDETAASGAQGLKFTDSAGPQEAWQPEMSYSPRFYTGTAVCSFDIRLEPGAILHHDWRTDWSGRRVGPRLKFNDNGELSAGDGESEQLLMDFPQGEWFHVEIECKLGKEAEVPATYSLAVSLAGQETKRFENLPCLYSRFRMVERCWFLSSAQTETTFYLDNVVVEQR